MNFLALAVLLSSIGLRLLARRRQAGDRGAVGREAVHVPFLIVAGELVDVPVPSPR